MQVGKMLMVGGTSGGYTEVYGTIVSACMYIWGFSLRHQP